MTFIKFEQADIYSPNLLNFIHMPLRFSSLIKTLLANRDLKKSLAELNQEYQFNLEKLKLENTD